MRRLLALVVLVLALPAAAQAHPLGNFTVNRLDVVSVSTDQVVVRHIVDLAEVPTFQERSFSPAEALAKRRAEAGRIRLEVDGKSVPLRVERGGTFTRHPGDGGLQTSRAELRLTAVVDGPRELVLRDDTYKDRIGWKAIVVRPGAGTAVRTAAPVEDVTRGLTAYPRDTAPPEVSAARLAVAPGDATATGAEGRTARGVEPGAAGSAPGAAASAAPGPGGSPADGAEAHDGSGFEGLFEDAAAGKGVLLFLLLAAFGWGALHALSPGHGKAMVAAYLVGTRGTIRDAVALGGIVTVTHTIGVFAIGAVALALSQYILPEDLYPWLTLISGLMVVAVGVTVLRGRAKVHAHAHDHHHEHGHDHDDHDHDHDHTHHHHHTNKGLLAMGASAGLIPCPSALVVLLGAVAQHEIALGLLLIVAFSLGLAATLTVLGILVLRAQGVLRRLNPSGALITILPIASALVICAAGFALAAQAVPDL